MKEPLLHDLYLGFIRIHILYHAGREKVYGAWLMKELAHHGYRVGPGTLYPMLHALEEKGLLVSRGAIVGESGGGIIRSQQPARKRWRTRASIPGS